MSCLADFGTFLSGAAAAGVVALGIYSAKTTIPNELAKWRGKRLAEIRAKAAARSLVAIHRLIGAAKKTTSEAFTIQLYGQGHFPEEIKEVHRSRWAYVQAEAEAFNDAWVEARVYLKAEVSELFGSVAAQTGSMRSDAELLFAISESREAMRENLNSFDEVMGTGAREKLDALIETAEELLLPYVRFDEQ